jgi:ABC-type sugar transport system permease subunit
MSLARTLPAATVKGRRRSSWAEIKRSRWAYLFIAPFYIFFAIFGLYPLVFSFVLSLSDFKGVGAIKYVGLANFTRLLKDTVFWQSLQNGVWLFFFYVPIMLFLALLLAVLLNSKRVRGFRVFRTLIFMPYITNMVAAGFTFRILLTQKNGLVNLLLGIVGISPVPWLESVWGARVSLSLLILWAWLGYNMVIMLAGLQTIPGDLTEAALVDGCTNRTAFFYITIPLMRPVILFCAVMSTIGSFGLFTEVASLTNGGPVNATITPLIRIYNVAFGSLQFGYASAMAYVFAAAILVLTLLQVRYFGREN